MPYTLYYSIVICRRYLTLFIIRNIDIFLCACLCLQCLCSHCSGIFLFNPLTIRISILFTLALSCVCLGNILFNYCTSIGRMRLTKIFTYINLTFLCVPTTLCLLAMMHYSKTGLHIFHIETVLRN